MRFVEKLYPEIDQESFSAPEGDIIVCNVGALQEVGLRRRSRCGLPVYCKT